MLTIKYNSACSQGDYVLLGTDAVNCTVEVPIVILRYVPAGTYTISFIYIPKRAIIYVNGLNTSRMSSSGMGTYIIAQSGDNWQTLTNILKRKQK